MTVTKAAKTLGLPPKVAANRLARLEVQGWVKRVRRGLYVVLPLEAGGGESLAIEDPWILARELFSPCYIGGWTAAEYWGLTEQLFRSTFVVSGAQVRRRTEQVASAEFHVVHLAPPRMGRSASIWRGRERVPVSDRERTIADALVSPSWVGGIRHLADMLAIYRESREWNAGKLLDRTAELKRGSAFKRLGHLFETLFPEEKRVIDEAFARRTTGAIKLDPAVSSRGKLSKRWGLWINVSLEERGR